MASPAPASTDVAQSLLPISERPMNPLIAAHLDPIANQYGSNSKQAGSASSPTTTSGATASSTTASASANSVSTTRHPYKSFRKKYRKLRLKFDTAMRENENLISLDISARRTIKRLNAENSRLLDMLMDLSESGHMEKQLAVRGIDVEGAHPEEIERDQKIASILDIPPSSVSRLSLANGNGENGVIKNGDQNGHDDELDNHVDLAEQMLMLQNDYESDY
ncbi:IEC3 subunit of the Ino80 complex, chromatin re-modelling-domain-containing protein [Kockiozyma suomiensis]|uniref:IEC3 subunit of the Ino80 complex, chromatin re-modelling-domain-containing protein n=1 Tax=Kockiozyma suomiensis TaxID=1337062 RepID=UPI003343B7F2